MNEQEKLEDMSLKKEIKGKKIKSGRKKAKNKKEGKLKSMKAREKGNLVK